MQDLESDKGALVAYFVDIVYNILHIACNAL